MAASTDAPKKGYDLGLLPLPNRDIRELKFRARL
jgi:hypothetical protein